MSRAPRHREEQLVRRSSTSEGGSDEAIQSAAYLPRSGLLVRQESWRGPAGERPVRVGRSGRPVASVAWSPATAGGERTQRLWGVWAWSTKNNKTAEAEPVSNVEGNMCGPAMRGTDALPWSKNTSRTKGTRRNLGGLTFDRWARCPPRPASGR